MLAPLSYHSLSGHFETMQGAAQHLTDSALPTSSRIPRTLHALRIGEQQQQQQTNARLRCVPIRTPHFVY
ncbi:hypothetical protein WN55_00062 [Dufourea novaeangliae]|uniref:Uncharacterized protein n=1 Tax=Dufourea novaeangliae TaxID=178035 RepID=A0A154NWB5_DUFNO|nr:hypothetical protein WN55_00062 [Dufourea novaeangliae]